METDKLDTVFFKRSPTLEKVCFFCLKPFIETVAPMVSDNGNSVFPVN